MNRPFDPFRVMETTNCAYPRLHGLDGREIAALHEWKCRATAFGYGLYKDFAMRRAAPIMAGYLQELAQNVAGAETEYAAAQQPMNQLFDPFRIMETTNCMYPRLHGLEGREIAALHEWKSRTVAA